MAIGRLSCLFRTTPLTAQRHYSIYAPPYADGVDKPAMRGAYAFEYHNHIKTRGVKT